MKYKKNIKIYLFKDLNKVDISFKVTKKLVITYHLSTEKFELLVNNWKNGINFNEDNFYWYVQHKKSGSKPENKKASFVRCSISKNGSTFHYRFTFEDFVVLEKDYFFQKNNIMFWDKDVHI